jgi:alkyldihydroxyacetonephosphate synthase
MYVIAYINENCEIFLQRCQPASLRLLDNVQYKGGLLFKEPVEGYLATLIDNLKYFYVTKYKGMDMDTIAVATALFEGW